MTKNQLSFLLCLTFVLGLSLGPLISFAQPLNSSTGSSAQEQNRFKTDSSFSGFWKASLQGRQSQDTMNQRLTSEFAFAADLKYLLVEGIQFHFAPQFRYLSGYTQTEAQSRVNQSEWSVSNASMDFEAEDYFETQVGILNQARHQSDILLSESMTFPALRAEIMTSKTNTVLLGVFGQGAIVTSASLSTQTKDFEPTPTYQSAGLFLASSPRLKNPLLAGHLTVSHWQYSSLPMAVATESGLKGNSVRTLNGQMDSEFIYRYAGWLMTTDLTGQLAQNWALNFQLSALRNDNSPTSLNQGFLGRGAITYKMTSKWTLIPAYEYFRIEPDATVASFNNSEMGTNSIGYSSGIGIEYRQIMRVILSGGEKDAIYESPFQSREKMMKLKVETINVSI